MKVLYFTQFYIPEAIAGAFRAAENARIWASDTHSVTVFTGYPNYPVGKIFDGYEPKLLSREWDGDVCVLRSKVIVKQNKTMFGRLQIALGGFVFGLINILFNNRKIGKRFDVVIGTSGMVTVALLGWLYACMHRSPFFFELRDITYRQLVATGKSSASASVKLMRRVELFLCRRARHIIVVTNGFKKILADDGISPDKISVITNGVDTCPVKRILTPNILMLSYFGTLGISQNIADTFPYAAAIARQCKRFEYLIIGEGAQRELIQEAVRNETYVRLMGGMPMETLEAYYEQTLLSVVTLRKSDDFQYTLPSKLFQIMGRGIAVLFIGPKGEAAEIVQKYNAGIVLCGTFEEDIKALDAFFSKLEWMDELQRMGERGAEAVKHNYSRKVLAHDYMDVLQSLGKKKSGESSLSA